jgi:putative oxidoreductase
MNFVLFIGQVLFAALFITSGIGHFAKLEAMTGYAQYKKLPAAKLGVMASGLFFLVGGILIVIGTYVDLGALLIAITLVLAAVIFHNFWKETDANTKMQEQIAFNKDIALAGAALVLFALVAGGIVEGSDLLVNIGSISLFN